MTVTNFADFLKVLFNFIVNFIIFLNSLINNTITNYFDLSFHFLIDFFTKFDFSYRPSINYLYNFCINLNYTTEFHYYINNLVYLISKHNDLYSLFIMQNLFYYNFYQFSTFLL